MGSVGSEPPGRDFSAKQLSPTHLLNSKMGECAFSPRTAALGKSTIGLGRTKFVSDRSWGPTRNEMVSGLERQLLSGGTSMIEREHFGNIQLITNDCGSDRSALRGQPLTP